MSNVPSNVLLSDASTVDQIFQVCTSSDTVETAVNETATGYFIASKDDANFVVLDPGNVTKALSDGFCVCYVDESLNGDCSAYPGTTFPDRTLEDRTQSVLINDTSSEFILLDHPEQLTNGFSRPERVDTFGDTIANESQLLLQTPGRLGKPFISTESPKTVSLEPNGSSDVPNHKLPSQSLECTVCCLAFTNKGKLQRHIKTHENDKPNSCSHCFSKFNHAENLLVHTTLVHTTADQLSTPYSCPLCPVRISRHAAFRSHVALHQIDEQLACDHCHRLFPSQSILEAHQRVEHSEPLLPTDGRFISRYRCHLCHTVIYSLGNLTKHYRMCHPGEIKSGRKPRSASDMNLIPSVTMSNTLTPVEAVPTESPPVPSNTTGKGVRASKLRAKAYLASLKPRPSKPRLASGDSRNLMIAVIDSTETQNASSRSVPEVPSTQPSGKPNPRVCSVCGKRFSKPCLVQRHMVRHTLVKPFECLMCHSRFTRKSTAQAHMLTHSDASTYFCPLCPREYTRRRNLVLHLERIHPNISVEFVDNFQQPHQQSGTNSLQLETNPCDSVSYSQILYPYPLTTDQPQIVEAGQLPDSVLNIKTMVSHPMSYTSFQEPCEIIELGPEQTSSAIPNRRPFVCSVCQKAFFSPRTLSVHLLRHSSAPLPYTCTHCARRFSSRTHQRYHIRSCHARNLTNRNKWPAHHQSLERSLEDSGVEGPIKWNATERRFYRAARPFYGSHMCNQCPRRYRNLSHLRAHVREQHNSSLACFACTLCRRRFTTTGALDRHMSRGHAQAVTKRRLCPICELSFVNTSSMKRHMVVHSSDRPYRCAWCFKSFKFHSSCTKHMKAQVCRSRLLVQSLDPIVVDTISSMNSGSLPLCPIYSDAFQLSDSLANRQLSSSCSFTTDKLSLSWPVCDVTMSTGSVHIPTKIVSIQYPLFSSSVDQNSQPLAHHLDLDNDALPQCESLSNALTWPDQNKAPVMVDSMHTSRIFIEQLPPLVQHSDSFEANAPLDLNIPGQSAEITVQSTETHGYTNLLMGSEYTCDPLDITNTLNRQPSWSYVTDATNSQSVAAAASYDQLTQSVEMNQSAKPCEDRISANLIGSGLHDVIHGVDEQPELNQPQLNTEQSQSPALLNVTQSNSAQSRESDHPGYEVNQDQKTVVAHPLLPMASLGKPEKEQDQELHFGCALCAVSFADTEALLLHSHTKHPITEKQYNCSLCDTVVTSELLLKVHRQLHARSSLHSLRCPLCPFAVFTNQSGLTRHINCCHPAPNSQRFRCSRCGDRFFHLRQLRAHITASSCVRLEAASNDVSSAIRDRPRVRKRRSGQSRILPLKPKDLLCLAQTTPLHNLSLSERYLIQAATEVVHGREKRQDPNQTGAPPVASTSRADINSAVKSHVCSVCARAFRLASDLKRHMCQHTGDRPFKCGQCDKQYLKHCQLQHHCFRVHKNASKLEQNESNRPRFGCHVCSRLFADKFSLFRHMRLHASRRRFTCPYCHRQFTSAMRKRTHMAICPQAVLFDFPKADSDNVGNKKSMSFLDQLYDSNETGDSNSVNYAREKGEVESSTNAVVVDLDELSTQDGELLPISIEPVLKDSAPEQRKTPHTESTRNGGIRGLPGAEATEPSGEDREASLNSHSALELLSDFTDKSERPLSTRFVEVTRCVTCAQDFPDLTSYARHECANRTINPYQLRVEPQLSCTRNKPNASTQPKRVNQLLQALYKCAQCDRLFNQLNALRRHEAAVHEQSLVCSMCGAKFTKRSSLISHERIHLNIKPYRCSHCAMKFRQRSNMRRHVKLIHT